MTPGAGGEPSADGARLRARPLVGMADGEPAGWHELSLDGGGGAVLAVPPFDPGAGSIPLLVMLHGAGGDAGQSMALVGDEARRRGVVVLAPSSRGPTWDALAGRFGPDVEAIDDALGQVFVRCPVDPARVVLAGFSDGASYALSLGLANGDLVSAIVAFSPGFAAPPAVVGRPRVLVTHGKGDRVLPIDVTSRRLVPRLRAAGYDVDYVELPGGHAVAPDVVVRALDWVLGPSPA